MEGATVANIRGAALRLQRQLVLDLGGTVPQLRMAAVEGSVLVDTVLSPVSGYDELPEDHAKVFKEYKKEQEKEIRPRLSRRPRQREVIVYDYAQEYANEY